MTDERFIRYRKEDIAEIKELYESIMTIAAHGLFFRTGRILGARLVRKSGSAGNIYEVMAKLLKDEGWVESVKFEKDRIVVKGSIEAVRQPTPSCHMLRGVLTKVIEIVESKKVYCNEIMRAR